MKEFENILDKVAKKNMSVWDLEKFKRTHPQLLRTILEAMIEVRIKTQQRKFGNDANDN